LYFVRLVFWQVSYNSKHEARSTKHKAQNTKHKQTTLSVTFQPAVLRVSLYKGELMMPKYVIERVVPGASKMSPAELKTMSQRSCNVLNQLGPQIQWVHSYVTDNKIYCVYIAPTEELVQEHARLGGFPANHVAQVKTVIDPTTSED
jgi:hypothetical protein